MLFSLHRNLHWNAGYNFNYLTVNEYSSDKYTGDETLFGLYRKWGILDGNTSGDMFSSALKAGLTYDSRDFEGVPGKTETWARVTFYRSKEKLRNGGASDEK